MKFEYKVELCWGKDSEHESWLNKVGEEGWELISVTPQKNSNFFRYIFKRLKQ
jgi:hypothetical protein